MLTIEELGRSVRDLAIAGMVLIWAGVVDGARRKLARLRGGAPNGGPRDAHR